MIFHKPFSLFFFIFSTAKMIRKMIMASIRMPITGHNAPNGSATTFEHFYKSMCVYLIQKYCPINNLWHGYIFQKKELDIVFTVHRHCIHWKRDSSVVGTMTDKEKTSRLFFCASWLVNHVVNTLDMYLYTRVLLTFSAGGPLVTFISGQNY